MDCLICCARDLAPVAPAPTPTPGPGPALSVLVTTVPVPVPVPPVMAVLAVDCEMDDVDGAMTIIGPGSLSPE